jgi:uncharacterized damage-inducible protein DinB
MLDEANRGLLEVLLDSWERNNEILVNLLLVIPEGGLKAKALESSPSVAQAINHIHYVRLVFIIEDAPEFAVDQPDEEWSELGDTERLIGNLIESAKLVRDAVRSRVEAGRAMELHYDHPILLLQHMIWHEGYHHGQIKVALKAAGIPLSDDVAGPATWDVWMRKL